MPETKTAPETKARSEELRRTDLRGVIAALRSGAAPDAWMARWLGPAHADPAAFTEMLYTLASARRGGLASSARTAIDLYKDCVAAHLGAQRRAFVAREAGRDVELTYEALHARSGALMSAWRAAGVEAGQSVCLLLPVGVDYVVSLVTALRMGLVVSAVPPVGPTLARARIAALAPDAVVAAERHRPLFRGTGAIALPPSGAREVGAQGSFGYAAGDPVLRLLPAFGEGADAPIDLPAARLHASLLGDALLVFALDEKDTLAMPGWEPLVHQPTSLLASLLAGAAFCEVAPADVAADPGLLGRLGVTVLGVGRALREVLLGQGKWPPGAIRTWFRTMTDPLDLSRWEALGNLSSKAGVAVFNTAISAAAGGALLFSRVVKEVPGLTVWPVPGRPWLLGEVGTKDLAALNDSGVFSVLDGEEPIPGAPRLLLTRSGDGYLCSGCLDVGPEARAVPIDLVSGAVERHPAVRHATVVVSPGRAINEANVTLIAFVEDTRGPDGRFAPPVTAAELRALCVKELGESLAPSRVEVFPLRPRLVKGAVDRGWCRSQYLGGAMTEKARDELFVAVSRLGYLLDVPAEGAEER